MNRYMAHKLQHARTLPPSVAGIAAAFETEPHAVVRALDIARLLALPPRHWRVYRAIRTLRDHGWLLPLPIRGAYEFVPASRGPYPSGDAWIELRAALDNGIKAQVGASSAAFLRGYSDRRPEPEVLFLDRTTRRESLERLFDVVNVLPDRLFGAAELRGLPVSTAERLVIEAAIWWRHAGDLRNSDHWLRQAIGDVDESRLRELLQLVPRSTRVKVAYLLDRFGQAKLARKLTTKSDMSQFQFLGPRPGRYQADWRLYDGIGVATL